MTREEEKEDEKDELISILHRYFKIASHLNQARLLIDECKTNFGTTNYNIDSELVAVINSKYSVLATQVHDEVMAHPNYKRLALGITSKKVRDSKTVTDLEILGYSKLEAEYLLSRRKQKWYNVKIKDSE